MSDENIIIAISGDSGVGKSVLTKLIANIFNLDSIKYECDRYHKWERTSDNWKNWTHLNPSANNIIQMKEDIYQLKIGNKIYRSDYDHKTGCFTKEEEIVPSSLIIVSGLHTLYDFNDIYNLKIFIEPQEELRVYWKIKRDHIERMYPIETVINKINIRKNDSVYITSQRNNADFIIKYYTNDDPNNFLKNEPKIYLKFIVRDTFLIKFLSVIDTLGVKYSVNNYEVRINSMFSKKLMNKELINNNSLFNIDGLCDEYNGLIQMIVFLLINS